MTLYVGIKVNMLQLRTTGPTDLLSTTDGLWFRGVDSEEMKGLTLAGRKIIREVFKKNQITRYGLHIDRILVASSWQMNVFRKTYLINQSEADVFVSAFEKAFGKKVHQVPEPRQLGAVML